MEHMPYLMGCSGVTPWMVRRDGVRSVGGLVMFDDIESFHANDQPDHAKSCSPLLRGSGRLIPFPTVCTIPHLGRCVGKR